MATSQFFGLILGLAGRFRIFGKKILESFALKEHRVILFHFSERNFTPEKVYPFIGEFAALSRFDRVDGAVIAFQEDTGVVIAFLEGQTPAIHAQPGKLLNEITFA